MQECNLIKDKKCLIKKQKEIFFLASKIFAIEYT